MRSWIGSMVAVLAASACSTAAPVDATLDIVHVGERTVNAESTAVAVLTSTLGASGGPLVFAQAASFSPAGCAVATTGATAATYTFTNCQAPYGVQATFSGVLTATASANGDVLNVDFASDDFRIGGTQLSTWRAATHSTVDGSGVRRMVRTAHLEGSAQVGGQTLRFARDVGPTNVVWGTSDGCISLDGSSVGTSDENGASSQVTAELVGIRRCGAECPSAGGAVHVERADGTRATITFLDGGSAEYTSGSGQVVRFTPACAP